MRAAADKWTNEYRIGLSVGSGLQKSAWKRIKDWLIRWQRIAKKRVEKDKGECPKEALGNRVVRVPMHGQKAEWQDFHEKVAKINAKPISSSIKLKKMAGMRQIKPDRKPKQKGCLLARFKIKGIQMGSTDGKLIRQNYGCKPTALCFKTMLHLFDV